MLVAERSVSIAGRPTEVNEAQLDMTMEVASDREGAEMLAREAKVARLKLPAQ
jgi:hypothetical protein